MKTAVKIELTFDQLLSMVRQLPKKQKIQLTKELEKEVLDSKLSDLLKTFKTNKLDLETINAEVEMVRQKIYDEQKS